MKVQNRLPCATLGAPRGPKQPVISPMPMSAGAFAALLRRKGEMPSTAPEGSAARRVERETGGEAAPKEVGEDAISTSTSTSIPTSTPTSTSTSTSIPTSTSTPTSNPTPTANPGLVPLQELFARFVHRSALGGDGRRASMRLTLGARHDDGEVVVSAAEGDVDIAIVAPPGVDAQQLETRVAERLRAKGVRVGRFDVR